jgi:hypothetical protein
MMKKFLIMLIPMLIAIVFFGHKNAKRLSGMLSAPHGEQYLGYVCLKTESDYKYEVILPALNCNWRVKFERADKDILLSNELKIDVWVKNEDGNEFMVWPSNVGQIGADPKILQLQDEVLWYSGSLSGLLLTDDFSGATLELNSRGLDSDLKVVLVFKLNGELADDYLNLNLNAFFKDSI